MESSSHSDFAVAVAERGDWSTSAISPKVPPGPTAATALSRTVIATAPVFTTYM